MSKIKMGDVFDLPVITDYSGVIFDNYCCAIGEVCGTLDQSRLVSHAINAHDALIEQNKALIEALEHIKKHQETVIVGMPQLSSVWQIASRALEK